MKMNITRKRLSYGIWLVVFIVVGLYSRTPYPFPMLLKMYAGDILWAGMIYLWIAFMFPRMNVRYVFVFALAFSFFIEFTQLLHMDWLEYLRTTILRYLLGQGFLWSDLICYSVGCVLTCILDRGILHLQTRKH